MSTTSSMYSTPEEKQAHEIRRLRKELDHSNDKVVTLTAQLTTNVSTCTLVSVQIFSLQRAPSYIQRNALQSLSLISLKTENRTPGKRRYVFGVKLSNQILVRVTRCREHARDARDITYNLCRKYVLHSVSPPWDKSFQGFVYRDDYH